MLTLILVLLYLNINEAFRGKLTLSTLMIMQLYTKRDSCRTRWNLPTSCNVTCLMGRIQREKGESEDYKNACTLN